MIALFLSLQLHAALYTVKFIDKDGNEPNEHPWWDDQPICLIDCADNSKIPDNNIKLAVGDQLIIQTPLNKRYGFWSYHHRCTIGNGSSYDVDRLTKVKVTNSNVKEEFTQFDFDALSSGTESFDIKFLDNSVNTSTTPGRLLGTVKVTITE